MMPGPIALTEGGDCAWFGREHYSRSTAITEFAHEACLPRSEFTAHARHIRPFLAPDDCDAESHDEWQDDCACYLAEEGWYMECERHHPDAIPVWRVKWMGWL